MIRGMRVKARISLLLSFFTVSGVLLFAQSLVLQSGPSGALSAYKTQLLDDQTQKLAFLIRERLGPGPVGPEQRLWLDRAGRQFAAAVRYSSPDGSVVWHETEAEKETSFEEPYAVDLPLIDAGEQQGRLTLIYDLGSNDAFPNFTDAEESWGRRIRTVFAVLLTASLGLHGLLAWRLARPLGVQAGYAEKIAGGSRDLTVPERGFRETRRLAAAINVLLKEFHGQEQWRQRMMQDLMHELRTPLTSILTRLEAMIDGVYPATETNLSKIYGELDRLSRYVDDMNKLSEAEAARFQLQLERTDLQDLVRGVCEGFLFVAQEKEIELVLVPAYAPCIAEVDPDRMVQVVSNLLANAIKYTPEGGKVEVGLGSGERGVYFYCRDNGVGIAEEELPNIFRRFYRARKSQARHSRGLGVGLSIVQALVDAHGGQVSAESEPGKGSVFTVFLPAAA